jgi:lysozyme family protein
MANFSEAFAKTMGHEGGYVNDASDAGGETFMGISRVYNPGWYGWTIIDESKTGGDFPHCLKEDDSLYDAVEDFYKDKYWDVNRLDAFPQSIAEEMFDTGVNMGVGRAGRFLQKALNYLNRDGRLFDDLIVDGKIGPASLDALDECERDERVLLTMLNVLQGQHYMNYMDKNPRQKKYARGWFKRVHL